MTPETDTGSPECGAKIPPEQPSPDKVLANLDHVGTLLGRLLKSVREVRADVAKLTTKE